MRKFFPYSWMNLSPGVNNIDGVMPRFESAVWCPMVPLVRWSLGVQLFTFCGDLQARLQKLEQAVSAFQQKSTTIQKKIQTLTTQVRKSCAIVTHRAEVVEVARPSQHPANLTKVASRSSLCKMAIESVLDAQIALGHNVHNFAEEPKAIRILLVVGLVVSGCFWILRNDSTFHLFYFFGTSGSKMFQASENLLVQAEEAKDLKEKTEERVWVPGFVGCDAFDQIAFRCLGCDLQDAQTGRVGQLSTPLSGDHGFTMFQYVSVMQVAKAKKMLEQKKKEAMDCLKSVRQSTSGHRNSPIQKKMAWLMILSLLRSIRSGLFGSKHFIAHVWGFHFNGFRTVLFSTVPVPPALPLLFETQDFGWTIAFWKSSPVEAFDSPDRPARTAEAEQVTKEVAQVEEKKKHVVTKVGRHSATVLFLWAAPL